MRLCCDTASLLSLTAMPLHFLFTFLQPLLQDFPQFFLVRVLWVIFFWHHMSLHVFLWAAHFEAEAYWALKTRTDENRTMNWAIASDTTILGNSFSTSTISKWTLNEFAAETKPRRQLMPKWLRLAIQLKQAQCKLISEQRFRRDFFDLAAEINQKNQSKSETVR